MTIDWTQVTIFLGVAVYLLPMLVAVLRQHHQALAIHMLTLLVGGGLIGWHMTELPLILGGAVVGWGGALIWACTATRRSDGPPPVWRAPRAGRPSAVPPPRIARARRPPTPHPGGETTDRGGHAHSHRERNIHVQGATDDVSVLYL